MLRPFSMSMIALLCGELATIAILLEMPPYLHHYILVLPPLIIFSVLGFKQGFAELKRLIVELRSRRRMNLANNWVAILFACTILISLIDLPWLIRYDRQARFPDPINLDAVVQYIEQNFRPDEYLLSDDALVLYLAGRLIPPSAIDFTFGDMLKYDPMSFPPLEQALDRVVSDNRVAGIIVGTRYERDPRIMSWIETNFPISIRLGAEHPNELSVRVCTANTQTH